MAPLSRALLVAVAAACACAAAATAAAAAAPPPTDAAAIAPDGGVAPAAAACAPRRHVHKNYPTATGAAYVLATHNDTCTSSSKQYPGEVLAFVTPWNAGGYDAAKRWGAKLTFVSPVWLQLRDAAASGKNHLTGTHDIDDGWVGDVKAACAGACRVLPRVILEARSLDPAAAAAEVGAAVAAHGWDGVVLEAPLVPAVVESLISALAGALAGTGGLLILVVPPGGATHAQLAGLSRHVHRFSVMTYDYSAHRGRAGPNAPLAWTRSTLDAMAGGAGAPPDVRSKLLAGMPFYGYDNGAAILGRDFLALLARGDTRLQLDREAREHFISYRDDGGVAHKAYYPTPWSVAARLDAAVGGGYAGVAVWEAGQGWDGFWDLL